MTSTKPGSWPAGDSQMAQRIRSCDWSTTPLGPITTWPQSLRTVVDLVLPAGFPLAVLWGPQLHLLYNDAYGDLIGLRHPDGLGQPAEHVWGEDWDCTAPMFTRVLAGETATAEEIHGTIERSGGPEEAWFTISCSPLRDDAGAVAGILLTRIECTDRMQAEAALQTSEQQYRSLFAAMNEGYGRYRVIAGPDGTLVDMQILHVNSAYERLMQRPNPAGKKRSEVEPRLDQEWLGALAEVAHAGAPRRFERYNATLGRWFDVHVTPAPGYDDQVVLVFSDITERKQGEEALLRNERWTRGQNAAFEAAMDGAPLATSLGILAALVHAETGGEARTAFYLAAADGARLHPVRGAGDMHDGYLDEVDGLPIGEASLACGLAMATGQPVITPDVQTDLRWTPRLSMARAFDVRGCWSFPIKTLDRQAVGSFAMHFHDERQATPQDLALAEAVTQAASVIITGSTAAEERARADAALQESEARYRALFAAIDEGYALYEVIFDEAGEPIDALIHEANPAYEQLTQRHDPVGKRLSEVSQGLDPVWGAAMAEVVRTGQPARFDGLNAEINRLFDVFIGPMDEPGNPHIVMILYDVTERRQATEALRASEAQLAAELADATRLQEVSSQLLLAGDSNALYGKILDAAIALMRADAGSMQVLDPARNELVLLAERGLAPASAAFWQRVEAGSTSSCAAALATSERVIVTDVETSPIIAGTEGLSAYRWSDLRAAQSTPLLARDGRVVGMLSTQWHTTHQPTDREVRLFDVLARQAADLLERVQAEDALRASEERYRLIVDRATDYAIYSTDQERRIENWPPGAAAVYGWTAEEAVGQLMDITYAPADRAAGVPEQEFAQARDTGHAPNVRWHVRKDGTYVFIEGDAYARRTEQGAFQGVFKIGQDMTARLAAEEAQREEEAVRREEEATLREELEAQVRVATAELRQLSRRLLAVQEEERRKLALELHDEVGQMLTGLNFQIAAALGAQGVSTLMEAQATVQALTEQVRQLSLDLRPAVLDRYGLLAALEWHIGRFQAKTGITVHLRHQGLDERFPPEVEIAAFRVVQEALTNVARHSGADFATVQVYGDGSLTLVIRDAGRGFDLANAGTSTGLGGMRERVELLGGRLEIEAIPGDGTAIIAELPAAFAGETAS